MFRKQFKHRKFDYIPRFYDPAKEDLDQRMAPYKEGTANNTESAKARIRSGFSSRISPSKKYSTRKANVSSSLRLLFIIGILLILTYFIFESDGMQKFLESLK